MAKPGAFIKLNREWKTGDEVVVRLPMSVRVQHGVHDSVSIHRGPLVYSLLIEDEKHVVGTIAPGFDEYEQTPKNGWNYALALASDPSKAFEARTNEKAGPNDNPFNASTTPIKLIATARKLPGWHLAWNHLTASDPPPSPVQSSEPEERMTLVPFGSEDLRLTDLPVLGKPRAAVLQPLVFTFDRNDTAGWSWIGGGWFARDGQLRTTPGGGAPGAKVLVENVVCANVRCDADVTPPAVGDAGIIFRVCNPSIGADAYQGYYAGISASSGQVVFGSADGKSWTLLKSAKRNIPVDKSTKLTVTANGDRIEIRLNSEPLTVISATDDHYSAGEVGLRVYSTDADRSVSAFDNIRISPIASAPSR